MKREKVFARAGGLFESLYLDKPKGDERLLYNQIDQPTYLRVTQPNRLDNEFYNVIIQEPRTLRGYRVPSIDLVFLTEDEMIKELRRN